MDRRFQPLSRDARRQVAVHAYPRSASPAAILAGAADPPRELTPFVSRLEQTEASLSFTLAWHRELDGAEMIAPDDWVLVFLNGEPLCVQQVEGLSDYRVAHGVKQCTVLARSRAARWREGQVTTRSFAIAEPMLHVVLEVAKLVGLEVGEVRIAQLGTFVPRADTQLSELSAWAVLEQVLRPAGLEPAVDALGRLYAYSRDVTREADLVLDSERVEALVGSRGRLPITRLTLQWRAPEMRTVLQAERRLAATRIMAGFFKMRQIRRLKFSEDGTQRAAALRLEITESVNRILPVAEEYLRETSHDSAAATGAAVVVDTRGYVPAFLGLYMAGKLATSLIADYHNYVTTVSYGRLLEAGFDVAALVTFMSVGEGEYVVHGRPIDAVEVVNTTEAYDPTAPLAGQKKETLESDFVMSEGHASAFVVREFMFRARAATSWTLSIVDDPRLELGDIVALESGERILVTGYRRNLSPSAPALLELSGFPV